METLGTLHAPVEAVLGLAANCAGYTAIALCVGKGRSGCYLTGSRDGSGFATLFKPTAEPASIAADSDGHICIAQGNTITRLTALGATTGSSFSVAPTHTGKNPPFVEVPTLQCLASDSLLAEHVEPRGFALFPVEGSQAGKVLFISGSNSLCQLDLGSKEVKSTATSSLYSCSEEGELQLLRSGLVVTDNMLAVNKDGDVLFFQPHPDNKALLSLVQLRSVLPSNQADEESKVDIVHVKRKLSQS
ncbi:hypothetical protein V8C86DRAFT_3091348 [Haematococcus lacustris]